MNIEFKNGTIKEVANLTGANLTGANLSFTDLSFTNLHGANLTGANLRYANLTGANLTGANLTNVIYDETTSFFALQCPEEGDFIGYKKCKGVIVKLLITGKRSSATARKCRCSEAKVLEIENGENQISSNRDKNFVYEVGKIVKVEDFDDDRWNECSTGIHFFITRQEAINY